MPSVEKLFLVGTHRYSFKAGKPAEIVGVAMITPDGSDEPRPCFKIRFKDGTGDFVPIFVAPGSDIINSHYELISEEDVRAGRIPEVVH